MLQIFRRKPLGAVTIVSDDYLSLRRPVERNHKREHETVENGDHSTVSFFAGPKTAA